MPSQPADPEVRRRQVESAQAEARSLARRLGSFLTEYGPIGAGLLTWSENQEISQGEDRLKEFAKREVGG